MSGSSTGDTQIIAASYSKPLTSNGTIRCEVNSGGTGLLAVKFNDEDDSSYRDFTSSSTDRTWVETSSVPTSVNKIYFKYTGNNVSTSIYNLSLDGTDTPLIIKEVNIMVTQTTNTITVDGNWDTSNQSQVWSNIDINISPGSPMEAVLLRWHLVAN